jgi:hypothetical protein
MDRTRVKPQPRKYNFIPRLHIRFWYTNWRGEINLYVVEVESVELGPYDGGGIDYDSLRWVLHGLVTRRNGVERLERRTFLLDGIRGFQND